MQQLTNSPRPTEPGAEAPAPWWARARAGLWGWAPRLALVSLLAAGCLPAPTPHPQDDAAAVGGELAEMPADAAGLGSRDTVSTGQPNGDGDVSEGEVGGQGLDALGGADDGLGEAGPVDAEVEAGGDAEGPEGDAPAEDGGA